MDDRCGICYRECNFRNNCTSMCNGVFKPVCEPEVCDVPRMSHYQDLAVGKGVIQLRNSDKLSFKLNIYRIQEDIFGEFLIRDHYTKTHLYADRIECYHAMMEEKFVAIFHIDYGEDEPSRELAVYGTIGNCNEAPKLYVYSAPFGHNEVSIGGRLCSGFIEIYENQMEMGH
ncbi:hypothetical protein lbkm_2365 [Lachnospiraceae bacterium KM106-2]|nr:hypothetical protein lbkm_2365 [Lachnospiraceae bacterium KM106-2]